MTGKEFFTTRTVAEALTGFAPSRRTPGEVVALGDALGRVPVADVESPHALPGFARSTVDGYAVRAADTYGSSEGIPSYLDLVGAVAMGAAAEVHVGAGHAVAVPTGGVLPEGADAVVMVEHTTESVSGTVEVLRAVAPGEGLVRADEDVAPGGVLTTRGRRLRAQDLALLAAAGVVCVEVHARPLVAILSTGDELVPASTQTLQPGQVRDATSWALAALVSEAGGWPDVLEIVPDDADALEQVLRDAVARSDLVVVSAGSSVGARDETAAVVARLGEPGIWCHGLAVKPGKPTLLGQAGDVPVVGLPGNPLSALVVFRLIGVPLVHRVGGSTNVSRPSTARAALSRQIASAAGRLDVVQVRVVDGVAEPMFGASALLTVLTRADGYVIVPEEATGLPAGADVDVTLYT